MYDELKLDEYAWEHRPAAGVLVYGQELLEDADVFVYA